MTDDRDDELHGERVVSREFAEHVPGVQLECSAVWGPMRYSEEAAETGAVRG